MGQRSTGVVGSGAEQQALAYLNAQGLRLVAKNFRYRGGEIDLIMLDRACLTFVEVRYRASTTFTRASHTVDIHKQRKIVRTAATFIARNRRFAEHTMRFDVVAVEGADNPTFHWIDDAFRPNDSTL